MSENDINLKVVITGATDVIGYIKQMDADDIGTVKNRGACYQLVTGLFEKFKDRLCNADGDSFLAEFLSAVSAVKYAAEFQKAKKETRQKRRY